MKNLQLFSILLLLAMAFIQACQTGNSQPNADNTYTENLEAFPKLLDRPENIKMGKEWENVTNEYLSYRDKILKDDQELESRLRLAQLFIVEARVTGEHGHYYPAALQVCDDVLERSKENKDMYFMASTVKAGVQLSQHDFTGALKTGQEALAINPLNAQVYGVLVDAYVELGEYDKAVEMADKMVSIRPDLRSYSRVSYLREIYGQMEGPENAFDAMNLAVDAGFPGTEESAWTRLTLGYLYWNYGRQEEAKEQFEIILDQRPNYPFAIAALGDLAMEMNQKEEAEKLLTQAAAIIPEVGFYESLALLRKEQGNETEYQKLVTEVNKMYTDDVATGHNMSMEYINYYLHVTPDLDKAMEYAQIEYKTRSKNIDVNRLLAEIYYKKGDYTKAQSILKLHQSQAPKILHYFCLRGLIAMANNDKKSGKKDIEMAFKLNKELSSDLAEIARKQI
ncbi:MAG: tetratricopeptide repeat protein [Saprospiraceae bacterium]|nr:tetratricopeptide repeat protein [Saprospiraceae bacterium]